MGQLLGLLAKWLHNPILVGHWLVTAESTKRWRVGWSHCVCVCVCVCVSVWHWCAACGFIYRSQKSPNGTFTSPNYPGFYPKNTECHYLFYGHEDERVHITFRHFDVEGMNRSVPTHDAMSSDNCCMLGLIKSINVGVGAAGVGT